jgi:mRNA interferase MazF
VEENDLENWYREKVFLNGKNSRPLFAEREVWYCSLGVNIGFEQDGKGSHSIRPIIVLKKFNNEIFWGVPLTHTQKSGALYFGLMEEFKSFVILSQIRLLDAKRLRYKIGVLNEARFLLLRKAFIDLAEQ